ncbi:radical SAM protein [Pelotomaculum propionicicum]|uniref:radical SAM protein n=1 Tax=Pelotomaculum propionicicum TaxID=258475 RepID=UPI003B7FF238
MNSCKEVCDKDVIGEIHSILMSEAPDLTLLKRLVKINFGFSPDDTRRLIYQVTKNLNAAFFPPVTKLEIVHTEGCNLACAYCFEKNMRGRHKIKFDTARKAVDLLFDYSAGEPVVNILHFGGEPTLNFPSVQKVTEYAEEKAKASGKLVEFHMTSNGVLINEEMAGYFSRHKIMVLLSIDGLEEEHNRFRVDAKGRGTFAKVLKSVEILKKSQQWVGVKMTVMPENAPTFFDSVLGLYDLGVNQFLISPATGVRWAEDDMNTFARQYGRLYRWYREKPRGDLRIAEFDEVDKYSCFYGCHAGRNNIAVNVNGDITSCSKIMAINKTRPPDKLGDVNYGLTHLENRFQLAGCSRLRRACESMGISGDYQGGCFAVNYEENGDLFSPSLQHYAFHKLMVSACSMGRET